MNKQNDTVNNGTLPDNEIIELYWQREENAIRETDKKYRTYLYTVAYNILSDRLDCEECLNDTYLGVWNQIPPKRPKAFQVFLSKITRNIALGRFRKMTAAKRIPPEMIVSLDELDNCLAAERSVEEEYDISEISRILSEYLRSLTDRQTFIFVCRYYYFDPVARIASMLHVSENTVFRDLSAIRAGLRERLEKEGFRYE